MKKLRLIVCLILYSVVALLVNAKAEEVKSEIKLSVSANPSLPAKNLIVGRNTGFEKGFSKWHFRLKKHKKDGLEVKIVDDSFEGKKALYVNTKNAKKDLKLDWHNGGFSTSQIINNPEKIMKNGEQYILACQARTEGGKTRYTGPTIGFYMPGYKHLPDGEKMGGRAIITGPTNGKWKSFSGKPFIFSNKRKTFLSLGFAVIHERGEFWVDAIGLYPAFTTLMVKAESPYGIYQITVTDDNGKRIYDSGKLKDKPKVFETTIKVLTPHVYKVRVMDYDGDMKIAEYPQKQQKRNDETNKKVEKN